MSDGSTSSTRVRRRSVSALSPRKTPVQRRSAATVECILEAAAHILERDGLGRLSTNAIARRAGTSIGSVYQYFPNKDAIVSALILRSHESIVAGQRSLLEDTMATPAAKAIAMMADMVLGAGPSSPCLARILEAEEARLAKSEAILAAERTIDRLNRDFLRRFLDPELSLDQVAIGAGDIVAIVRALLEVPLAGADLRARIIRTIEAYLAPLLNCANGKRRAGTTAIAVTTASVTP